MKRLLATLHCDLLRQARYGLIAVSIFVVVFWGVLLGVLVDGLEEAAPSIIPAFLAGNTIITTFYFMAALVLFERSENTLSALIVTPLRFGEYLVSKGATLAVLALFENVLVVVLLFGVQFNWPLILVAVLGVGLFYAWIGFVVILRYESINTFLLPSILFVMFFALPLLSHFGFTGRWMFGWHPVEPALTLMRAAYLPSSQWELTFGVVGVFSWASAAFALAKMRFGQHASNEFAG